MHRHHHHRPDVQHSLLLSWQTDWAKRKEGACHVQELSANVPAGGSTLARQTVAVARAKVQTSVDTGDRVR